MKRNFEEYVERKRKQYGLKLDLSDLDMKYAPYFDSGQRIKVDFAGKDESGNDEYGHTVLTGTVGVTTGWKPAFMLMRTKRSLGSMWLLDSRDKVLAEQKDGKYVYLTKPTADACDAASQPTDTEGGDLADVHRE